MSIPDSQLGNDELLDREQIELLLSLDDGAGTLLEEILGEFFVQADDLHAQLLAAVGNGDHESVRRVAHALRGASANVGATRLASLCAQLEAVSGAPQADDASALVASFDSEYSDALNALQGLSQEH